MKELHISDDLSLPLEAVTNTHLIPARRRVGKSYTAAVMAEEMVKAGLPWAALDPTGVWWGLTSSADGKREGFPVIIIGGPHAHIPLEPSAGKVIANLIVDNPGWYVIDFSRFDHRSDEIRFATDFGVQLYRRKQRKPSAMHLFVDEADMFVPQKLPKHGGKEMFDAYDAIVRRGGVYGLGVTLITQRPAIVNKDVSTQCETLIALQTSAPQDQDPIFDWVSRNGTDEQLREIKRTLAGLKVGQAWFFSPNSDVFKMIKIRTRETFNSSATPKPGAKPIEPKVFAEIDVEKLGAEVAATVERSKQEDPEYLRRQIAQLQRQLTERQPVTVSANPTIERVEVHVITDEQINALEGYLSDVNQATQSLRDIRLDIENLFNGKFDGLNTTALAISAAINAAKKTSKTVPVPARAVTTVTAIKDRSTKVSPVSTPTNLPEGQAKILQAVIQFQENGLTPEQISILVGYKRATRDKYLGQLIANELGVKSPGSRLVYPTQDGIEIMPNVEPLPTGDHLRYYWSQKLPIGEVKIMDVLYAAWPEFVKKEDLDDQCNMKRATRDKYIGYLRARYLIEEQPGMVRASSMLFG